MRKSSEPLRSTGGTAAEHRVLPAGLEALVIGIGAVGARHRAVVLLDARLHLLEELRLQGLGRRHGRIGMGVLGLQVGADIRVEQTGIAHHLAPVVGAQPGIGVLAGLPVQGHPVGLTRRHRRGGGFHGLGGSI
jgi:hypothetical protein